MRIVTVLALMALAAALQAESLINDGAAVAANDDLESLKAKGAAWVEVDNVTIVVAYRQVTNDNQDPICFRFDDGTLTWVNTDIETADPDGKGVGLLFDGERLVIACTVDGGSNASGRISRHCSDGWLTSYGSGGGAAATVLLRIDLASGAPTAGSFIRAKLNSGKTNTATPSDLAFWGDRVVANLSSFFAPVDTKDQRFNDANKNEDSSSPFEWRVILSHDLSSAMGSEAVGWNGVENLSLLPQRELSLQVTDGLENIDINVSLELDGNKAGSQQGISVVFPAYDPSQHARMSIQTTIPQAAN